MTPRTLHRLWCAWVRYWLPIKSVRDSRAYALGPARNKYGLPVAGEAVNKPDASRLCCRQPERGRAAE
jgi:hypothetical protein